MSVAGRATDGWRARQARVGKRRAKEAYRNLRFGLLSLARRASGARRMLPELVVLGAQKAGTTSLFDYLSQHPQVRPPARKEVHFFDLNYAKGLEWYRANFPAASAAERGSAERQELTLDASPYYLFHPAVPARLKPVLPDAKFVVMLRDPVDRAYSHYWHEHKLGYENATLQAALAAEPDRLRGEAERLHADAGYRSFAHQHYSYLSRGIYVEQIERWFESFPPERFLFIKSEDFFSDPEAQTNMALRFVGLPECAQIRYRPTNVGRYLPMEDALRGSLQDYYRPFNERLSRLLARDFGW